MTDRTKLYELMAIRDSKMRLLKEIQRKRFAAERAAFSAGIAYHDAYDEYASAIDDCVQEEQKLSANNKWCVVTENAQAEGIAP